MPWSVRNSAGPIWSKKMKGPTIWRLTQGRAARKATVAGRVFVDPCAWPHSLPVAWWLEPWCASRREEWKLHDGRLDLGGDPRTQVGAVASAVLCKASGGQMSQKPTPAVPAE